MNKQEVLKTISSQEDQLFLSKMFDLSALSEKRRKVCFSSFLDEHQKQVLLQYFHHFTYGKLSFYGGYHGAQREIAAFFPDFVEDLNNEDYPLCILEIRLKRAGEVVSHRDYLGTILSLGIKREKVGDLLVYHDKCIAIADAAITQYICDHINKVKNQGVSLTILENDEIALPEVNRQEISGSVSSVRLDVVLALCRRLSRSESLKVIVSGKVSVNFMPTCEPSCMLKEGDIISAKGFGRSTLSKIGTTTKKGLIMITVHNYR